MIRLNETNPRLDRRNTFVDESHSGHVANYLVHDLVVPARRRETEGSPLFPRCSGRSPIDSSPRSGSGFSFESSLRGGALRSALGKSSSRALELPFYDSAFIEACTFQSGPRHNRSAYAPRHHGEGASNRREYHPNQPYPRGVEGAGRGEISFLEIREHRPPIRVFTPPSRGYYVTARTGEGVEAVKREKEEKEEIPSLWFIPRSFLLRLRDPITVDL